jgi:gamma-glutamyltranspeptidase/glutathione hydrolase/leukotriene-C4 hydrolase
MTYFYSIFVSGGLAIGIPGEIKGLWLAHQIGGKLPWKDLLQPIIKLCREGIVVGIPVAYAMSVQTETIKTQLGLRYIPFCQITTNSS